jgi:prepilin-type N-terminal cleavage/methylation domain-containing protein
MFRKNSLPTCKVAHKSRQRGFGVIEMVIVVLIIAIIAAFVLPVAVSYIKMYRLSVAARNVATALQRARYLATSNNKRAAVLIHETQRLDIEQYDPNGIAEPEKLGAVILPEGIVISEAPEKIAFDGRGVVTPLPKESPTIRVNGDGGYYSIVTVSPTGQVTISDTRRDDV